MNLKDKNIRIALAEKYLAAETSVKEEIELAAYYSSHRPDEDEKVFAAMLSAISGDYLLSDEGADEFDRIAASGATRPKRRVFRWVSGIAAAAAATFAIILPIRKSEPQISPLVIYEGISSLIKMNPEIVESVNAIPQGNKVLVTVNLKNGDERKFLLSYDEQKGTTSFSAYNNQ
ncbi:MAG: hypothetical protein J6L98_06290 [Bacteroidales bacterium]|nr:hypothetical protein [Bacteroidales bacterium]